MQKVILTSMLAPIATLALPFAFADDSQTGALYMHDMLVQAFAPRLLYSSRSR